MRKAKDANDYFGCCCFVQEFEGGYAASTTGMTFLANRQVAFFLPTMNFNEASLKVGYVKDKGDEAYSVSKVRLFNLQANVSLPPQQVQRLDLLRTEIRRAVSLRNGKFAIQDSELISSTVRAYVDELEHDVPIRRDTDEPTWMAAARAKSLYRSADDSLDENAHMALTTSSRCWKPPWFS